MSTCCPVFLKFTSGTPRVYWTVGPTGPNPRCLTSLWSTMGPPTICGVLISDQVGLVVPYPLSTRTAIFLPFTPLLYGSYGWGLTWGPISMGLELSGSPMGPPQDPWTRLSIWWATGSHNPIFYSWELSSGFCFLQIHA